MSVFRVEKTGNYTVMSNHHLRNRGLSLKAKGLLSQMLSLPDDWDYTLAGLSKINRESVDAIRTAVQELEKFGYIIRRQCRDEQGKMTGNEYTIYEQPRFSIGCASEKDTPGEGTEESTPPLLDFPTTDFPIPENPTQLSTYQQNTENREKKNTKRKGGGRKRIDLTDDDLKQKTFEWIESISDAGTSPDAKNDLYLAVLRFYAPRSSKKVTPAKTQAGFDCLTVDLVRGSRGDFGTMVFMLNKATLSKWKSVYPPSGMKAPEPERQIRANEVIL